MRLVYWKAQCLDDHDCYSIRRRTRREANEERNGRSDGKENFAKPKKVVIEYEDAFDLVLKLTSEGGAE